MSKLYPDKEQSIEYQSLLEAWAILSVVRNKIINIIEGGNENGSQRND